MVHITDDYSLEGNEFEERGFTVPKGYSFNQVRENTSAEPIWVHFGGGNLFRCMQAAHQQILLEKGVSDKGIILAETWDDELISDVYHRYNNRALSIILKENGWFTTKLIDSVTEALYVNKQENSADYERLLEIFRQPSLQLVTLTITEKGYNIFDLEGEYLCSEEVEYGPDKVQTVMGIITAAMLARFETGAAPIALLSTDNFSHNGDKLKASVLEIARNWDTRGYVPEGFIDYLNDGTLVSFPFSVIDRITPAPSPIIAESLAALSFEDVEIVKTAKFTTSAAFVNTEETNYLVVENDFPNGRPPLEQAGVIFTTREKVDKVERMKVCTCLNPLHTALAILGCLLGYTKISEEVKDEALLALIKKIGYDEGMPVVTDPQIISPKRFIDEVINNRLPNPFIPDTPQRIATDTSHKLPIRFGVTIDLYHKSLNLDVKNLRAISFVLAAWLRYLLGIDDEGEIFERSPDPMLNQLDKYFAGLKLGSSPAELEKVKPLLADSTIFGVDLNEVGLGDKIFGQFVRMCAKPGEVRELLEEIAFS
jgi:fructuronate reductase